MSDFTAEEFDSLLEKEGIKRVDERDIYEVSPGCVYWVKEAGKTRREVLHRLMNEAARVKSNQRFSEYAKCLER